MHFYVFEGKRIKVRNLIGRAYIDPRDDSVYPVYRDKGGNFYIIKESELCNFDEFWDGATGVYRHEMKMVPERDVSGWCILIDQVENGCFDRKCDER